MKRSSSIALATAIALAIGSGVARAADEAEINAIIKSLAPIAGQTTGREYESAPPTRVIVRDRTIYLDYTYSIDLEVYFAFDSATLTAQAKQDLDALGHALESRHLRPYSYLIAGHTDAKGSAAYNQGLSERRAAAVGRFLLENYAIEFDRLYTIGMGESQLKDPAHPRAGINRRVEVTLIVPPGGISALEPPQAPASGTTIVVPPPAGPVTITIEKDAAKSSETVPADQADPRALPPCPDLGDDKDLDDISPRPGIDCAAKTSRPGTLQKGQDGDLKITW